MEHCKKCSFCRNIGFTTQKEIHNKKVDLEKSILVDLFKVTGEVLKISKESKENKINEEILDPEVRVIDAEGKMIGVLPIEEALVKAEESKLDLVSISPNANPPVCKIMDYGKYKYDAQKREKIAKKKQKTIQVKEIRLSTFIEEHDVSVKAKTASKFLNAGDKVKITVRFRRRENDCAQRGLEVMKNFAEACKDAGFIEKNAKMEGRNMTMFLAPNPTKK